MGFLLRRVPVPVLPVAVWGTEASLLKGRLLPRRVPLTVRFGPVFAVEPDLLRGHDNQLVADRVGERLAALLPPPYRGVYGSAV